MSSTTSKDTLYRTVRRRLHNARFKIYWRYHWELPHRRIIRAVTAEHGYTVQSGPFSGMIYDPSFPTNEALVPRLLGYYESELHQAVDQAVAHGYDTVIDIGSSEGYYAVGLARLMPDAQVYAFDIETDMQARCRAMSALNEVEERVHVRGLCDHDALQQHISGETLVVSDCEGGELDLLDPARAPSLLKADLIVECHDHLVEGVSAAMRERFEPTHHIALVSSMLQDPRRFAVMRSLKARDQRLAVDERRPVPMQWMIMTRRR
jgi:hypothetical protein